MKHLFKFSHKPAESAGNKNTGSSPELKHINTSGNTIDEHIKKESFINVKDDFPWTNSPQRAIEDSPYIDLLELDIKSNPQLNQIANNLAIIGNLLPDEIKARVQQATTEHVENEEVGENDFTFGKGQGESLSNALNTVAKGGRAFNDVGSGDTLFPYDNMYTVEPTGWRYILPYYTDSYRNLSNSFTDSKGETGSGMAGAVLDTMAKGGDISANIGRSANVVAPGQYVEKSKFFSFSGREKTYTFGFPIANTRPSHGMTAEETISRNWQLLYLLVYQNSPNRMTKDLILPPTIYEAHVPGVWYSKYSYISNLDIQFLGTRRRMEVTVPVLKGDALKIDTIIPDVYQVTISVTQLLGESQNMLYHMIKGKNVMAWGNTKK